MGSIMAPKAGRGAGAKAKAAAARRVKNGRRDARRAALALLNDLADEVGAVAVQVDVKNAGAADVERTIRVLDARGQQQPALAARLRVATFRSSCSTKQPFLGFAIGWAGQCRRKPGRRAERLSQLA